MASSLKRSFKDRAKEKLGFGSKTKAQSVDTAGLGIMNPLSWDNLSSDIKDKLRGESIPAKPGSLPESNLSPRLSMELKRSDSHDSNEGLAGNNVENNKKPRVIVKPKGTMEYRVKNSDTLPKIAAQFDTTPSELCNLNRLSTRFIFPGQTLFVPDLDYYSSASDDAPTSPVATSPPKHKPPDIPCIMQVGSPVKSPPKGPGLAERVAPIKPQDASPPHPLSEEEAQRLDRECYERFIKLNVKHITDGQGVVSGVLLVTPNAIMFDPNVSDPLVIEHGADAYGMIATMDTVISVAMYHDIAAMKLKGANKDQPDHAPLHKPEVYHSKTCPLAQHSMANRRRQETENKDAKPSGNVKSENNNKKVTIDSKVSQDSDDRRVQTSHGASSSVQSERGSTTDQSGISCQKDKVGAVTDTAQGGAASAIMDDPSVRRDGAMKLLDPEEGKMAHVRFRDTTEDINACLEPSGDEVKVGSVESGIAEMEEEDKDKSESSPPPLTPHMQIGNIMYFQYGSVDTEGGEGAEGTSEAGAGASEGTINTQEKIIPIKPFPQEADETSADAPATSARVDAPATSAPATSARVEAAEHTDEVTKLKRSEPIPAPLKKPTGNLGKGSFSPLNFSPNFSSFVDFSSGLFSTNKDDRARVKDIAESSMVVPSPEMTASMEGSLEHTQVTQTEDGTELITLRRSSNSTWYTKPFQMISDTVSNTMTTSKPDDVSAAGRGEKPPIELEVESAVRLEDKPELFQSIDELVNTCTCLYSRDSKLIPRPAKQFEDPPLYLCLKVGIPLKGRQSGTCPIEAYSRKRKKPEYWFSIPREKVDHLYAFFIQWSPNLYGDEIDPKERGFVIIEDDDEVEEDMHVDFVKGRITRSMSKDWEIVHVDEARRRLSILEVEDSLPLPELVGNTVILSEEHVMAITKHLPARAEGYPWTLIYSSDQNGFSLKTLYRAMYDFDTPVLLVIKDTCNSVFGAMTSCALKWSDHFYGTGETFLYTFYPEFKVFNWSGENNFFIKGNKESLAIGAGKGSFGIWLDGDLYHGRTQHCDTYNNEPLSVQEDFIVKGFEAWGFV